MSITDYVLNTASFPEGYAERLIDVLEITQSKFLSVKDALYHFRGLDHDQAAEAMRHIMEAAPEIASFDEFEIEPRVKHWEDGDPHKPDHIHCDEDEEHEADMWRLYGTVRGRDSVCIGEYNTRALAEEVYAGITGRRYAAQTSRDPAKKPYSVLLLYPDDVNDSGTETYYAFVEAPDALEAVAIARREAVAAQEEAAEAYEPDDFARLLVIAGHHFDQPVPNQ